MATYLQLVNETIREAGADIDQLSTIVTTGNTMQSRFCNWVIQSWEDIQTDNNGWDFMKESGAYQVYPRIHFYDGDTNYETLTSMEGIELTPFEWTEDPLIIKYFSPASASQLSAGTEGYIDLRVVPDVPLTINIPTGLKLTTVDDATDRGFTGYFHHWGWYNLDEFTTPASAVGAGTSTATARIAEVDWQSVRIYDDAPIRPAASGASISYSDASAIPLTFFTWDNFRDKGLDVNTPLGRPQIVTETPEGTVAFYPAPDKAYMLRFSYTLLPQTFSADSDTPTGLPARYHRAISWLAVMKYAMFDEQPSLYRRAEEEFQKVMRKMRRDLMPEVKVSYEYKGW